MADIERILFENQDEKYRDFNSSLVPTVDKQIVIGVRVPVVRNIGKTLLKDCDFVKNELPRFLNTLPHKYYEENLLHSYFVSECKDFDKTIELTNEFLPYIDNWGVCDTFNPKSFAKNKEALWECVDGWLHSDKTYTVRFGIITAMRHYLDGDFTLDRFERVIAVKSDEYYVKMALAWYMSVALIKQYDIAVEVLKEGRLDVWTHNKSIQKALESYRITDADKDYLRTLKKHD